MTATPQTPRLSRALPGAPAAPPIRIVHLGIGNFHRAHQAWYTAHASDAAGWGIAAFTGRRPDAAEALSPQDGLYTLITRGAKSDELALLGSLVEVRPADDHDRLLELFAAPQTAVVTITVTEAGYRPGPGSTPAKIVAGLQARRAAGSGPLTILSCDNLPHNGSVTRTVVTDLAREEDESLVDWIEEHVEFASSMVDRITPATTDADRALVLEAQGYVDASPVPTEPFSEWVISGTFAAGRPDWESAGAQIVEDVAPHEQRKLTLLNGSHSLLAYAGSIRGHASIDEAIADPTCLSWVEQFWDEAERHLILTGPQIADYRAALLDRYRNARIRHLLAQIAADGSIKIGVRILPTVRGERAAGRLPVGCATALAAWVLHLRGLGAPVNDAGAEPYVAAAGAEDVREAVVSVLSQLDDDLGNDDELVDLVVAQTKELTT